MHEEDAEKITFRPLIGIFCYVIMSFRLKNARGTYQKAMTTIFHDMIHKIMEDYFDDIVLKFKKEVDHMSYLIRVFKRCRPYWMWMNPLKYAFSWEVSRNLGQ